MFVYCKCACSCCQLLYASCQFHSNSKRKKKKKQKLPLGSEPVHFIFTITELGTIVNFTLPLLLNFSQLFNSPFTFISSIPIDILNIKMRIKKSAEERKQEDIRISREWMEALVRSILEAPRSKQIPANEKTY